MGNTQQQAPIPTTAMECWVYGFKQCKVDAHSVSVYLGSFRWINLAWRSGIQFESAILCVDRGLARVQVYDGEQWETDDSTVVTFHIMPGWPPDKMIIIANE